jgi:hypothetical protein
MAFFDDKFADVGYRMKVLKMFPDEFAKGYALYKQGKLMDTEATVWTNELKLTSGWYLLDPGSAIKFNINGSD